MLHNELLHEIDAKNHVVEKVEFLKHELQGFKLSSDDPYTTWLEKCKDLT